MRASRRFAVITGISAWLAWSYHRDEQYLERIQAESAAWSSGFQSARRLYGCW